MDSVRVIGNEAVHGGEIDLKDDRPTAMTLFDLVNFVIEKVIAEPKAVQEMYSRLPASKLQGIEARARKKRPSDQTAA